MIMQLFYAVKLKTNCKHFTWKNILLVNMNKINQNMLKEPHCELDKLNKFLSCSTDCKWFEKK